MKALANKAKSIGSLGLVLLLFSAWVSAQQVYRVTDIGTLEGSEMLVDDLNESGQVTGGSSPISASGVEHAFLWDGDTLVDLGALGGFRSMGHAINDAGQVTGRSEIQRHKHHPVVWENNSLLDLDKFGSTFGEGADINNAGQVTGYADVAGNAASHAFLWDGTTLRDLGTPGDDFTNSRGEALNASGQVTGWAYNDILAGDPTHAILWDGATMRDLGTLGYESSQGLDINDSGQVTGYASSLIAGRVKRRAFLWNGSTMQDLGTLGGSSSSAHAINAAGQVAGTSDIENDAGSHAFLWDRDTLRDLGTLGGTDSAGHDINDSGQVIGTSDIAGDVARHAFVWSGSVLYDLNDLIDPADPLQPFVTFEKAGEINNRGQIVATGCDSRTDECHPYVLSPVAADAFLDFVALSDVNGNGSADAAVLMAVVTADTKVYVKDGVTGETISDATILNDSWRAIDMAPTPGGANALVGVLAQKDDNSISVAVHRASNGTLVKEIPFFGRTWVPSKLVYVPNADGPGGSAFAVVAKNTNDGRVAVQIRRRSDGSLISTTTYFEDSWEAIDFQALGDISGNNRPELAVLGHSSLGQIVALMKDASTKAVVNKTTYFGKTTTPVGLTVIEDIGAGAAPELPVLGRRPDASNIVQNRDALSDERVSNVSFFNPRWNTIDIEGLGDVDGNTSADLAVLAQHDTTRAIQAEVRDAFTGGLIRAVTFLGASWDARAFAVFDDINGNGAQELGVVGRNDDGEIRLQLRDASTGSVVKTIAIP